MTHRVLQTSSAVLAGLLVPALAQADDVVLSLEIPRLTVAEYHAPYVAIWIETPDHQAVSTLQAWYDYDLQGEDGATWLKDLRQWWRRAGRSLALPSDEITQPTRTPGTYEVSFSAEQGAFADLSAGEYNVVIEAAREVGGRELIRLPITWPLGAGHTPITAQGESELGALSLTVIED
ncbi:DUF2271 domain-containing protein [Woodsholea maritima]|uniref:DUF2271 domain-containing protein n=1 Tax=Woodsholea maritima TaxID=240237 RepID=UPI00037B6C50|nr:DUF2271 domain-containing protein [Woodsholea maritima]